MGKELRVGAAKYNITPALDQARRLGPKELATDVVGQLFVRATVFDDGKTKAAIVVLDISEFFPNITEGIRALAGKWTDIPPEHILVCATHTHSGAKVIDYDDPYDYGGVIVEYNEISEGTRLYLEMLYRWAASAIFLADSRLKPVVGKIGEISVPNIGRPRARMKDGSVASFTYADNIDNIDKKQIESFSFYDDTLRVAVFEDMKGSPVCGLANFGCHNALAMGWTTLDSDFFGWAMDRTEEEIGKRFVFSLMAGPEGNVHPAGLTEKSISAEEAASLVPVAGNILYEKIKEIWNNLELFRTDSVSCARKEVYFPVQQPTPIRAKNYLYRRKTAGGKQDDKGVFSELQIIRIGELAILGLCGEVFHEIAFNLRKISPFKYTWVTSLCNDELSYLMPEHEYKRDKESGKMNVQKEFAIPDETAEARIYEAFKELFEKVK
ncbi:MAG: hypothetical protein PHI44_01685 [Candidatus Ratteibacteria bacterium]|nr:hypothetical protein [Candidatus Ratteibacteria bacterium]